MVSAKWSKLPWRTRKVGCLQTPNCSYFLINFFMVWRLITNRSFFSERTNNSGFVESTLGMSQKHAAHWRSNNEIWNLEHPHVTTHMWQELQKKLKRQQHLLANSHRKTSGTNSCLEIYSPFNKKNIHWKIMKNQDRRLVADWWRNHDAPIQNLWRYGRPFSEQMSAKSEPFQTWGCVPGVFALVTVSIQSTSK